MRKLSIALLVAFPVVVMAQSTAYLTDSWWKNGNQYCKYSNGTVLNVGAKTCPTSIKV